MIKIDKRIYQHNITITPEDLKQLTSGDTVCHILTRESYPKEYEELEDFDEVQLCILPPPVKVDLEYEKPRKNEYKVSINK